MCALCVCESCVYYTSGHFKARSYPLRRPVTRGVAHSHTRFYHYARAAGAAIIHVRLAVPPDYRGVSANTDLIREWMALSAWQEDTWGTAFIESLEPHADDFVITHTRNSAFYNTTLDEILFQLGVRNLVCAGVSTAYAVEGTVRHATDIGYKVTVAADACSTATHAQHENALAAMKPLASIKTVDEILADLAS